MNSSASAQAAGVKCEDAEAARHTDIFVGSGSWFIKYQDVVLHLADKTFRSLFLW